MNAKNSDNSRLWLALGLFLLSALFLRLGSRAQEGWSRLPAAFNQDIPPLLGAASFLGALGGARAAAADLNYIGTLQYLGDFRNREDGDFKDAYNDYRELLWLDPYFHFAVLEGCSFLVWFVHRVGEGQRLMEEAMRVDPSFSRYRMYYAAMAYTEKNVDHAAMLAFLKSEVEKPDAPEMLLRSVGNILTRYGSRQEAIRYWAMLLRRAHESITVDRARTELAALTGQAP